MALLDATHAAEIETAWGVARDAGAL